MWKKKLRSNEVHWVASGDFSPNSAPVVSFSQIVQIVSVSTDVFLSAISVQMRVISAVWIRDGAVAANIHVTQAVCQSFHAVSGHEKIVAKHSVFRWPCGPLNCTVGCQEELIIL